jgi:hypothetical protein
MKPGMVEIMMSRCGMRIQAARMDSIGEVDTLSVQVFECKE